LIFTANRSAGRQGRCIAHLAVRRPLDDINQDGMIVIRELAEIFAIHEIDFRVLAASIRNPVHMTQAALAGAHIATVPFKIVQADGPSPADRQGHRQFKADWEKARRRRAKAESRRPVAQPRAEAPRTRSRAHHPADPQVVVELDESARWPTSIRRDR